MSCAPTRLVFVLLCGLIACNDLVFGDVEKVNKARADAGSNEETEGDDGVGLRPSSDGGTPDAAATLCDPTKPFTSVTPLAGPINSSGHEVAPSLTSDEKTIVFQRTVGADGGAILQATRGSLAEPFGTPSEIPVVTGLAWAQQPAISANGLTILFVGPVSDESDVFRVQRAMPTATFGAREVFAPANSIKSESFPAFTANGEELWVASDRNTGGTFVRHLYRGTRDASGNYGGGARATELESGADDSEFGVAFSRDGLTIYFGTDREGEPHVYSARRASIGAPFSGVAPVAELKSSAADIPGWLSPDNCRFYFASERGGTSDLFVAVR